MGLKRTPKLEDLRTMPNVDTLLRKHDAEFDTLYEDHAAQQRGKFLRAFPLRSLRAMTIDEYVIGKGTPTFCAYVEPLTKLWANILGATAFKFGIYHGRTKSDPAHRYRFVERKFGHSKIAAFSAVKDALLRLIEDGRALRFEAIDKNPLSQMFKAKILSLYFPDKYLNICSREHISDLSSELGLEDGWVSEQQHYLLEAKLANPLSRHWSNPKYMTFLYNTYIRSPDKKMHLKVIRKRQPPKIDVEEMLEHRKRIGKMSEEYALAWERERLHGLDYGELAKRIEDRRDQLSYGYDFLSYSEPGVERYIEVKTAGRNWTESGYRFFLSEHERQISLKPDNAGRYYFYLVYYEDRKPAALEEWRAEDLYKISNIGSNGYVVAFDRDEQ